MTRHPPADRLPYHCHSSNLEPDGKGGVPFGSQANYYSVVHPCLAGLLVRGFGRLYWLETAPGWIDRLQVTREGNRGDVSLPL